MDTRSIRLRALASPYVERVMTTLRVFCVMRIRQCSALRGRERHATKYSIWSCTPKLSRDCNLRTICAELSSGKSLKSTTNPSFLLQPPKLLDLNLLCVGNIRKGEWSLHLSSSRLPKRPG